MAKKLAFLFPGQGSQYAGMAGALYAAHALAERTFREANDIVGWDLARMIREGDRDALTRTDVAQPALLAASVAAYRVVREEWGLVPALGAGHSLGELSALCCAGVLSFPDALRLVKRRGELMHEAAVRMPGTMLAVIGLEEAAVREELRLNQEQGTGGAELACLNAPRELVLSGEPEALETLAGRFTQLGGRATRLAVGGAFHSRHMRSAEEAFAAELARVAIRPGEWPVVANRTALPYEDGNRAMLVELLSSQLTSPVRWTETMSYIRRQEIAAVVELGPKAVLKGLAATNAPGLEAYAIDVPHDYEAVRGWGGAQGSDGVTGAALRKRFLRACITAAVCTPSGHADAERYRSGVIEPYRQLERMEQGAAPPGIEAQAEQLGKALDLVRTIFAAKRLPQPEQEARLGELTAALAAAMDAPGTQASNTGGA